MRSPLPKRTILPLLLCLLGSASAQNNAALEFGKPEYRERYYALVNQLRCLVCQNQTIADSNAELAIDLRRRVHEMIEQGASDQEVIDFMSARYGDFVLYNPPLKPSTLLLWFAPFIVVGIGSVLLVLFIVRRNSDTVSAAEISESVRRRVEELSRRQQTKEHRE
jgi:cytochrome c-type biogenesis protein CcmH